MTININKKSLFKISLLMILLIVPSLSLLFYSYLYIFDILCVLSQIFFLLWVFRSLTSDFLVLWLIAIVRLYLMSILSFTSVFNFIYRLSRFVRSNKPNPSIVLFGFSQYINHYVYLNQVLTGFLGILGFLSACNSTPLLSLPP